MFYLLIALSVIGYAMQGTLIVAYSRRIDALSLAVYRNVSLIFVMLPLLLLSSKEELQALVPNWYWMALAGVSGTIGLAIMYRSLDFLAVGISSGLRQSAGVLSALLLGFLFFRETISGIQFVMIVLLLTGAFILGKAKNPMPHLDSNTVKGIFLSVVSGAFIAFSFFIMGKLARDVGPATSGYFLECSIGIFSLLLLFARMKIFNRKPDKISLRTFAGISLASSPTLLGTGAAAWAITLGPFGIMRAYSAAGILLTVVFSHFLYGERLSLHQWIGLAVLTAGIVGVRLC